MIDSDAFNRALTFAMTWHQGQYRKGSSIPYVTHVVAVADALARYYPSEQDLVIAGLLHDTVEDTGASFKLLETTFGKEVTRLVRAVTKPEDDEVPEEHRADKTSLWEYKRLALLEHLNTDDRNILRLKAADALANLQSIYRDLLDKSVGNKVWSRFKGSREQSLWYYQAVQSRVQEGLGDEPLVLELRKMLAAVEEEAEGPAPA
jgi:(p)ppGpp synthase/HD superfamily hydrolase